MKKSLLLLKAGFESSSLLTPEFAMFSKIFKKELTAILTELSCTNIEISRGHFYLSGFFKRGTQIWYFSISDVRYFESEILFRTATSFKDYTGGVNQYLRMSPLKNGLDNLTRGFM
jgi:hypothetical protein